MLAGLFVSACLLASAAALNATSTTAAPSSPRSLPFASSTCTECRRPHAPVTAAAVEGDDRAPPAPRGPKKLVASPDRGASAGTPPRAAGLHHHDPAEDGDDPVHDKQALHESAARMAEDLRKEEDDDEEEEEDADLPAEQGRAEGGRGKNRQTKLGKKVDGSVLHMMMMLKMMPLMFVSTKIAVLGFLVQLKSLVLSLVSVGIAAVEFFWRFQEKRQRAGAAPTLQTTAATHGWQEQGVWPDRRKYVSF